MVFKSSSNYKRKSQKKQSTYRRKDAKTKSNKDAIITLQNSIKTLAKTAKIKRNYGMFLNTYYNNLVPLGSVIEASSFVLPLTDPAPWTRIFQDADKLVTSSKITITRITLNVLFTLFNYVEKPITITVMILRLKKTGNVAVDPATGSLQLKNGDSYYSNMAAGFNQGLIFINRKMFHVIKAKRFTLTAQNYTNQKFVTTTAEFQRNAASNIEITDNLAATATAIGLAGDNTAQFWGKTSAIGNPKDTFKAMRLSFKPNILFHNPTGNWSDLKLKQLPYSHRYYFVCFYNNETAIVDSTHPNCQVNQMVYCYN